MSSAVSRRLSRRAEALSPSPTLALAQAARELRRRGQSVVDLGVGEPDFATPEFVAEAGIAAIREHKTKYTESAGIAPLREAVAAKYRARGAAVSPAGVVISAGGKQALFNACQVLFEDGDEVAIFSPYWVSFPEMVRLAGAAPVIVPTRPEEGFRPRLAPLSAAAGPRLKGVIVNSPCNPTGAAIAQEELLAILRWARERDIYVLFDECYELFLFDGRSHASPAPAWEEHGSHTILSGAVSKTFSMTGWRLGWAVAAPDIASAMASLQSHSTSNATSISQEAALAALTDGEKAAEAVSLMLSEYTERRRRMVEGLGTIPGVACGAPDGAFYAFADVSALLRRGGFPDSTALSASLLSRSGLVTVPGDAFGAPGYLRLSFAASRSEIDEGLARLKAFAAAI